MVFDMFFQRHTTFNGFLMKEIMCRKFGMGVCYGIASNGVRVLDSSLINGFVIFTSGIDGVPWTKMMRNTNSSESLELSLFRVGRGVVWI